MSKIIGVTVGTPTSPKSIEKTIHPVKSVNGVAPDEKGNVQVEEETIVVESFDELSQDEEDGTLAIKPTGGKPSGTDSIEDFETANFAKKHNGKWFVGEGVKSWNDLTDKPFGEETHTEELVIEWDGDAAGKTTGMGGSFVKISELAPEPSEVLGGQIVTDGVSATITEDVLNDARGEGFPLGGVGDSIIFCYEAVPSMDIPSAGTYVLIDTPVTTLIYTGTVTNINHLDPKFLSFSTEKTLIDGTVTSGSFGTLQTAVIFIPGSTYFIDFDGVRYSCVARQVDTGAVFVGNMRLASSELEDNGMPILYATYNFETQCWCEYIENLKQHTVKVSLANFVQIPKECLPETNALPPVTSNDKDKVLTANEDGTAEWKEPTGGANILTFDSVEKMNAATAPDGAIALVPSTGGSGGGLPVIEIAHDFSEGGERELSETEAAAIAALNGKSFIARFTAEEADQSLSSDVFMGVYAMSVEGHQMVAYMGVYDNLDQGFNRFTLAIQDGTGFFSWSKDSTQRGGMLSVGCDTTQPTTITENANATLYNELAYERPVLLQCRVDNNIRFYGVPTVLSEGGNKTLQLTHGPHTVTLVPVTDKTWRAEYTYNG